MDKIKIVSLNVRGLGSEIKRCKIYRFMKKHNANICLLQETHCTKNLELLWSNEWGNKCLFANGMSNSRGVSMLLTKLSVNTLREVRRDINGRYIVC